MNTAGPIDGIIAIGL
jgi:hypothetical protein